MYWEFNQCNQFKQIGQFVVNMNLVKNVELAHHYSQEKNEEVWYIIIEHVDGGTKITNHMDKIEAERIINNLLTN